MRERGVESRLDGSRTISLDLRGLPESVVRASVLQFFMQLARDVATTIPQESAAPTLPFIELLLSADDGRTTQTVRELCASLEPPVLLSEQRPALFAAALVVPAEEVQRWSIAVLRSWEMRQRHLRFGMFVGCHNFMYVGALLALLG
uniref:Uncharacterized protein n=1 Tax=Calcidiscus leptoporus TaxID=127549 RepID=A0A7S0NYL0_9EUKA